MATMIVGINIVLGIPLRRVYWKLVRILLVIHPTKLVLRLHTSSHARHAAERPSPAAGRLALRRFTRTNVPVLLRLLERRVQDRSFDFEGHIEFTFLVLSARGLGRDTAMHGRGIAFSLLHRILRDPRTRPLSVLRRCDSR